MRHEARGAGFATAFVTAWPVWDARGWSHLFFCLFFFAPAATWKPTCLVSTRLTFLLSLPSSPSLGRLPATCILIIALLG
jgi:hypothetical protein